MSQPLGVAILGSGLFVRAEHLPAVTACNLVTLKALYSRTLKSAQETASQIKDGSSSPDLYSEDSDSSHQLQDLLARDDIHAVIIALPIVSQPKFIEAALAAGKHVLAEKPIAKDVATAKQLIERYHEIQKQQQKVTLSIAENFRFMPRFQYAGEQVSKLGRVTHFSVTVMNMMRDENKYYKTEWRAKPEYQGGFLLDGGVHHAAGTRMLLGSGHENQLASVRAFTSQVQPHLPPIDTVTAIVKTVSGATGTFQHSAGSLMSSFEWHVACENGSVKSSGDVVTVTADGGEPLDKTFEKTSGVKEEVESWAKGILSGQQSALQSPEEALKDLEFLEKMFTSGDKDGEVQTYELQ